MSDGVRAGLAWSCRTILMKALSGHTVFNHIQPVPPPKGGRSQCDGGREMSREVLRYSMMYDPPFAFQDRRMHETVRAWAMGQPGFP